MLDIETRRRSGLAVAGLFPGEGVRAMTSVELLPSWNDGPAKQAVLDFVASTTTPGPSFVEVADRIAAFDNDGTLWSERPLAPQFDFVFRRWGEEVKADPSLAGVQPYKALLEKDMAFFAGVGTQDPATIDTLLKAFSRSWAGSTPAEFDAEVRVWLETVKQPKFDVPYIELVYKPMLELIEYLKAHEFRVFVCSGGGRDFMRTFAEETWGIYKENVIGTAADYRYTDGRIVRAEAGLGGLDIGPGKPEHIFAHAGRLPVLAGGNADVDIELLESATFSLIIDHDDDDREFAYTSGAEASIARAKELGWTVVSVKKDWNTVYGQIERS
ncbi:HAD family phosphatase [Arthrobacter sp. ov118]|uniref:HAD family hydrolase n=1 Tax=Arthrobacter sp. ov118 TaxID=1761747 RepID=UPI00210C74C4|nr:HAD family hydrolase [Arthrobacter sp. ov118]